MVRKRTSDNIERYRYVIEITSIHKTINSHSISTNVSKPKKLQSSKSVRRFCEEIQLIHLIRGINHLQSSDIQYGRNVT